MTSKKIKVLLVEDSHVIQHLLSELISKDERFELCGIAGNGLDAIDKVIKLQPNVVSMDINMPIMDGLEATREIMKRCPVPILIVSSLFPSEDKTMAMQILEAGAVAVLPKPYGPGHPEFLQSVKKYLNMLESMSEIKVVLRRFVPPTKDSVQRIIEENLSKKEEKPEYKILAIGASAGGPEALKTILSNLSPYFPLPIILVQHIDGVFADDFCNWLKTASNLPLSIAYQGEFLLPRHVYMPPGNRHLKVLPGSIASVTDEDPIEGSKPSINVLFESVTKVYGGKSIAVLLSGMGKDGADGLKMLHDKGAFTIAQEEKSCLVYGMPRAAVELNAVNKILSPIEIAKEMHSIFNL